MISGNSAAGTDPRGSHASDYRNALIVFAFFWCTAGYRYFVNAGIETVPIIERAISSDYLRNDYYLNLIADTLHHRFVYVEFLAALSQLTGGVEMAMLVAYIVLYALLFERLSAFVTWFSASRGECLAVLIAATVFLYYGLSRVSPGEVGFLPNETVSNLFARAILMTSVVAVMAGRSHIAFIFLVLAACFHPLEALLAYPFLLAVSVLGIGERLQGSLLRPLIRAGIWFIPLAIIVLAMSSGTLSAESDAALVERAFARRLDHHYLPSSWPWWTWLFAFAIAVIGSVRLRARKLTGLSLACLLSTACFVVYLAALSTIGGTWLFSLQGAKVMMLPYVVWTFCIAADLIGAISGKTVPARVRPRTVVAAFAVLVAAGGAAVWLAGPLVPPSLRTHIERQSASILSGNYRTADDYVDENEAALYRWLSGNTQPDAVILHPPELQMIRPLARRSSVVQAKLIGFTVPAMREWIERMDSLENYCDLGMAELDALADRYEAQWIVRPASCPDRIAGNPAYANPHWLVLRADTAKTRR